MRIDDVLLLDDDASRQLAAEARNRQEIVECVGVLDANTVRWRPVLVRSEKKMPNSVANYNSVRAAVLGNLTEPGLKEWLSGKIGNSSPMTEDTN